ncbi:hypothetical protein [Halogranum rubrum]|uniref:Uncharacterized protein n=1 Tax=Halogranum salarium B-1 TaxID=1210908 RepID=J2Z9S6_9EURY|nr:hypothetical protein [Halogranum salarium]EJN57395.1 hypothetical protein HSB1_43580 [Halogranum salarium B-1]
MRNGRTPLSASAEDALDVLRPAIEATETGLGRPAAHSRLEGDDFIDYDATEALSELLQKGYLYEVDGELRLP